MISQRYAMCVGGLAAILACAALAGGPALAQEGMLSRATIKGDPVSVCGNLAYVANVYSRDIAVIDMKEERLVKKLPTTGAPLNPTFSADWTKLYVANLGGEGSISIIDTKTATITRTISAGRRGPSGLRTTKDGKYLVISFIGANIREAGALGVMDLATEKLIKLIPVQAQSERFDITPDGKRAYVANLGAQTVSVVDLEQGTIIATIPVEDKYPFNVIVSPRGHRAFVGSSAGSSIAEIDTATNKVLSVIKTLPGPNGLTFTTDGDTLLMTNVYAGTLSYYNLSVKAVSQGMPVGLLPGHLRLTPDGRKGIFGHPYGRDATIFDGTTLQVLKTIETGVGPSTVAICGNP